MKSCVLVKSTEAFKIYLVKYKFLSALKNNSHLQIEILKYEVYILFILCFHCQFIKGYEILLDAIMYWRKS